MTRDAWWKRPGWRGWIVILFLQGLVWVPGGASRVLGGDGFASRLAWFGALCLGLAAFYAAWELRKPSHRGWLVAVWVEAAFAMASLVVALDRGPVDGLLGAAIPALMLWALVRNRVESPTPTRDAVIEP